MNAGVSPILARSSTRTCPAKRGPIGHDYTVAQNAIVSDVRLRHDETIITSLGEHSAAGRAAMNGNKLTNCDFVCQSLSPTAHLCTSNPEKQARWKRKERCGSLADRSPAINHAVRFQPNPITQFDFFADNGIGSNIAVITHMRA